MAKVPYVGKEHRGVSSAKRMLRAAKGHGRSPRIAVAFDRKTFDHVAMVAKSRNVSFADVVRELVQRGIAEHGGGGGD